MRVITAPGVEITEIDKSQYSPAMTGTTCYIAGFADKGEVYQPMEFTTRAAWTSYYGEPSTEAEKYFYNACVEVINQNGRLYCTRLPYDNGSFEKLVGYNYTVDSSIQQLSSLDDVIFNDICAADNSIKDVLTIKGSKYPIFCDLSTIDEYRTNESTVGADKILIVDKTCATYNKIQEDTRKGQTREMVGILPVVTTAANALYAQSLITVAPENAYHYEVISSCTTLYDGSFNTISTGNSIAEINNDLVKQLYSKYKHYTKTISSQISIDMKSIGDIKTIVDRLESSRDGDALPLTDINESINDADILADTSYVSETGTITPTTINELVIKYNNIVEDTSLSIQIETSDYIVDINKDTLGNFKTKVTKFYQWYYQNKDAHAEDGDDTLPSTVSFKANEYFSTIEYDTTLNDGNGGFKREHLKDIGVIVFKMYVDSSEGNKIAFEPVEAFCGSLYKKDKDPTTGITKFIDDIVNNTSEYIYLFSNCFNTDTSENAYLNTLDMLITPTGNTGILGFYEYQTDKLISVTKSIYDGLNKSFDKVSDINERDIDIVCDAGVSNIASFLKDIGLEAGGHYDLTQTIGSGTTAKTAVQLWKCNSTDSKGLKTWKTVVQKLDTFCKSTRKDCMFITECPRPLVIAGQKKIVRTSKPSNTIDANILPYVKLITGLNTNYGAGYMDWFEIADEFSGDFFWLPPSIKAMGIYINTDVNYNYWDAPAGLNRGVVAATDVAFSPNSKQAGSIYEKCWNYAINYPSDGIVLEGQKTFQVASSAFDRVNVRRLFLRLERQAYKVARYFVYEGNTAYTRQRLVDALDPYFKEAKIGGGIYDYKIICDETVNTAEVIDRNELKVKIGIKPTKTAEFILIDFIALSTGGSFEEAMG